MKRVEGLKVNPAAAQKRVSVVEMMLSPKQQGDLMRAQQTKELFMACDQQGKGHLTRDQIRLAMRTAGAEPDDGVVDAVMKELDADGDGKITYLEFMRGFESLTRSMMRLAAGGSGDSEVAGESETAPDEDQDEEKEVSFTRNRSPSQASRFSNSQIEHINRVNKIKELFTECDVEGRGKLDRVGLRKVLTTLGVDSGEGMVDQLISYLDSDGDGQVDFTEFVRGLISWEQMMSSVPQQTTIETEPGELEEASSNRKSFTVNPGDTAAEAFQQVVIEGYSHQEREERDLHTDTSMLSDQIEMALRLMKGQNPAAVLAELAPILSDAKKVASSLSEQLGEKTNRVISLETQLKEVSDKKKAADHKVNDLQAAMEDTEISNQKLYEEVKTMEEAVKEYKSKLALNTNLKDENTKVLMQAESYKAEVEAAKQEERRLKAMNRKLREEKMAAELELKEVKDGMDGREEELWKMRDELAMLKDVMTSKKDLERQVDRYRKQSEVLNQSLVEYEEMLMKSPRTPVTPFFDSFPLEKPKDEGDPNRDSGTFWGFGDKETLLAEAEKFMLHRCKKGKTRDQAFDEFLELCRKATEEMEERIRSASQNFDNMRRKSVRIEDDLKGLHARLSDAAALEAHLEGMEAELSQDGEELNARIRSASEALSHKSRKQSSGSQSLQPVEEGDDDDDEPQPTAGPEGAYAFLDLAMSMRTTFVGDLLDVNRNTVLQKMLALAPHEDETFVVFSDFVSKLSKRTWRQRRMLVITQKAVYSIKKEKSILGVKYHIRRGEPISTILAVSSSSLSPDLFCIHLKDAHDFVAYSSRRTEIVSRLGEQYRQAMGIGLRVDFSNNFVAKNKDGTKRRISVEMGQGSDKAAMKVTKGKIAPPAEAWAATGASS